MSRGNDGMNNVKICDRLSLEESLWTGTALQCGTIRYGIRQTWKHGGVDLFSCRLFWRSESRRKKDEWKRRRKLNGQSDPEQGSLPNGEPSPRRPS